MTSSFEQFVKANDNLVLVSEICFLDGSNFENLEIALHLKNGRIVKVLNHEAIDIVMQLKPSLVEGKKLKFAKHAWVVHNLVGHPLMQLLAFFKLYTWAFWVHEATVPKPLGKKDKKISSVKMNTPA